MIATTRGRLRQALAGALHPDLLPPPARWSRGRSTTATGATPMPSLRGPALPRRGRGHARRLAGDQVPRREGLHHRQRLAPAASSRTNSCSSASRSSPMGDHLLSTGEHGAVLRPGLPGASTASSPRSSAGASTPRSRRCLWPGHARIRLPPALERMLGGAWRATALAEILEAACGGGAGAQPGRRGAAVRPSRHPQRRIWESAAPSGRQLDPPGPRRRPAPLHLRRGAGASSPTR